VDSAEKIYTLAGKIRGDLTRYSKRREKGKVKLKMIKLRDLVGTVDAMVSKLYADLAIMDYNDQTKIYEKHTREFKKIYKRIQDTRRDIMQIVALPYFNKFPELRQKLYVKMGFETLSKIPAEERERMAFWGDYDTFKMFVGRTYYYTRAALLALNTHIEKEFGD